MKLPNTEMVFLEYQKIGMTRTFTSFQRSEVRLLGYPWKELAQGKIRPSVAGLRGEKCNQIHFRECKDLHTM